MQPPCKKPTIQFTRTKADQEQFYSLVSEKDNRTEAWTMQLENRQKRLLRLFHLTGSRSQTRTYDRALCDIMMTIEYLYAY